MPSKVFFSSCFTDPVRQRLALRDRIIDGFDLHRTAADRSAIENFPVWMAESWEMLDPTPGGIEAPPGKALESAMICVEGVRKSDVYFAVARQNYGSAIETAPRQSVQVSYFEIELFEAALLQKPAVIFLLEGAEPTGRLKAVLDLLEPALPGLDRTPRSEDYIYARLVEAVEGERSGRRAPFLRQAVASGARMADQLMGQRHLAYDPAASGPPIRFLNGLADLETARPDGALVETVLAQAAAETNHPRKLTLLWMAIRGLMGAPPSRANDQFVPLWVDALTAWNSAGAWYGLHGHPYMGCLASLGSLNQISEERAGLAAGPHGGFASEYYSIAKHVRLPTHRHEALRLSMGHIDVEARKGEASGTLGLRGSILFAMGDTAGAIEDYRRALHLRQAIEGAADAAIGESMTELGFALVRSWNFRLGRRSEGLALMEQGVDLLERGPATGFVVRAKRKLGRAYALAGAPRRALGELAAAYEVAREHGMDDQVGKLDLLAQRIDRALPWVKAPKARSRPPSPHLP